MKHEHPPISAVGAVGDAVAEETGRSKAHAPVKAGRAIVLFSVVAVAVAITGVFDRRHDEERLARWTDEQAIPTVALVSPQRGAVAREVVLPGDVEAFYNAAIHGQTSGYVREWRKDIGAKVRQGDILAVVDTPELDQRISVAESELVKAKANLQLARVTAQRWNSLAQFCGGFAAVGRREGERRQRQGRRSSGGAGQPRPFEGAEDVRQHRRAVRRRRHGPQHRHRIAGQGGLERQRGPVHRRRHPSDARLCACAGVLCGRIEERHEGDPPIAGIPRSHLRGDDRNDLARDRQEVALAARRTLCRQQGRRTLAGRVCAGPFSNSSRPERGHASGQCDAVPRQWGGSRNRRA